MSTSSKFISSFNELLLQLGSRLRVCPGTSFVNLHRLIMASSASASWTAASLSAKSSTVARELIRERRKPLSIPKVLISLRRSAAAVGGAVCLFSDNDHRQLPAEVISKSERERFRRMIVSNSSEISASVRSHVTHNRPEAVKQFDLIEQDPLSTASLTRDVNIRKWVQEIREIFRSMGDGEISLSPYDTAWVSLIPAVDGTGGPQFPGCVRWIIDNQCEDGSWGDPHFFTYSNNVLNTLMCVIALKTWNVGLESLERGVKFIQENLERVDLDRNHNEMLCAFELNLPQLVDEARKLGLDIQHDLPLIDKYRARREKKLKRLPLQLVHSVPTTILFSLEGIREVVNWDQILQFQQEDGSFLSSTSSTACAYLHTGNEKCLEFLTNLVTKFNQAAPAQYPVDLFERMWVVDKLERLGIARYFESEIRTCLDFVYKYYSSSSVGVSWASTGNVPDLDDSAMAFRLLRQHGYDVSTDCFQTYRNADGSWYTFAAEMNQSVTSVFNFYRAGQTRFPEENVLREGAEWAHQFLTDKFINKDYHDKWVISRDLGGEVRFALRSPWHCTPPRLEHRSFLDQYGPDDIWISKVLYRMLSVNKSTFLNLAKADFNLCQAVHREELEVLLSWHEASGLGGLSFARDKDFEVYRFYMAVCSLSAPELSMARRVWAQQSIMATALHDFFNALTESYNDKCQVLSAIKSWNPKMMDGTSRDAKLLFEIVYNTINVQAKHGSFLQERDISYHIQDVWTRLAEAYLKEAEWAQKGYRPSLGEYMMVAEASTATEVVTLAQFFLGEKISHEMFESSDRTQLLRSSCAVNRLCNDLQTYQRKALEKKSTYVFILRRNGCTEEEAIKRSRQVLNDRIEELVKEAHQPTECKPWPVLPRSVRQLHFNISRSYLHTYQTDDALASTRLDIERSVSHILYEPVVL